MAQNGGRKIQIEVGGTVVECLTIGGLAAAVRRTPRTIRDWERRGLIPPAPFILPGEQNTKRRLYPTALVKVIEEVVGHERFGRRRPSGRFLRQQAQIYEAWNTALEPLRKIDGITEDEHYGSTPDVSMQA